MISAIDAGDSDSLADELGDLLLQVILHCQIASEEAAFSIDEVIDRLSEKLVRRHPHVFANSSREMAAIRSTWETVKEEEGRTTYSLPTILAARKLSEKLGEERVIEEADYPSREAQEGGKILAAIAFAWSKGIDPELALRKAMIHLSTAKRTTA